MKILRRIVSGFIFVLSMQFAHAQDKLSKVIIGTPSEANYLANGYISPFLKAMGTGINQGWYNTAKPHKIVGFDLTVSVSPVFIPNSDLLYEVDNSKLSSIKLQTTHDGKTITPLSTGKGSIPTIFGPDKEPTYVYTSTGNSVSGPPGLGLKDKYGLQALPVPIANLGIGLPKGTDLKLRYIPTINLGDQGKLDMFGIGIMHDVKQWIPGIKHLPFDLSAFVGYTKLKLETSFDKADQKGQFEVTGTTIQGLISKKISVLTVYGGVGYNIAKSKIALKGTYDLNGDGTYNNTTEKDPVNLEATASGLRGTAGMRLKLAIFTFHGDYTLQKYKTLTVGFGLAIR